MNKPKQKPALPAIKLTRCKSTNVDAHGYDAATRTLVLRFKSGVKVGATYHYTDVPPDVAEQLAKAESVGGFFASSIRGKFESVKQP